MPPSAVPAESSRAFAELHFATYLGSTTSNDALQTTDLPPSDLPISGRSARSYEVGDAQEALSDALGEAIAQLLRTEAFVKSLRGER